MNSTPLTIEAFCKSPSLAGPSPSGLKLAPDGACLTFLRGRPDDKDYHDLWRLPLTDQNCSPISDRQPVLLVDADRLGLSGADGTELSAEEKARRERMRVAQAKGILQYYWSGNSEYILLPAGNTIWLYKVSTDELELLPVSDVEEKGAVIDAQLSPDSAYVSYLREDNNLYVFHLATKREIAITTDGTETIRNGVAEFVGTFSLIWHCCVDVVFISTHTQELHLYYSPRRNVKNDRLLVVTPDKVSGFHSSR